MQFIIPSLGVLATTVFAAVQLSIPELPPNPPSVLLSGPHTNAKRFAIGLPPLPPKHRHRSRGPNGGSKADTARRTLESPSLPLNTRCNILVKKATGGSSLGYLSPSLSNGIYGRLQSSQEGALELSFSSSPNDPSSLSQLDISVVDLLGTSYPYLGGITSYPVYNEIGPGLTRYVFIGGTAQTPRGSPSVQVDNSYSARTGIPGGGSQNAIWKFNSVTRELAAQWVNPDGSLPPTYFAYDPGRLFLTGDAGRLNPALSSTVIGVNFTCVAPGASQTSE